jgi:hypothetical protein
MPPQHSTYYLSDGSLCRVRYPQAMKVVPVEKILHVLGRRAREITEAASPARPRTREFVPKGSYLQPRAVNLEDDCDDTVNHASLAPAVSPAEASSPALTHSPALAPHPALGWSDFTTTTVLDDDEDMPTRKQRLIQRLAQCPYYVVYSSPTKVRCLT